MEHDLLLLRINISDELLCKRDEPMAAIGRLHFQKCVSCRSVDSCDDTYTTMRSGINNLIAGKLGETHLLIARGLGPGEKDRAVDELSRLLSCVDPLKLDDGKVVAAETIFLYKERYDNTVDFHKKKIGISAVENIIREIERQFAAYSMDLSQASNPEYFVGLNHLHGLFWPQDC